MSSSLISILNNSITNYSDNDPNWRQFVLDHKNYLIQNSTLRQITTGYLQSFTYNLAGYLRSINYSTDCAWIIALINNLPNDVYFKPGINFMFVPPFTIIEALYTTYITVEKNT